MSILERVAENVWECNEPLKAAGLRLEHRMTVMKLRSGVLIDWELAKTKKPVICLIKTVA
jgi:hypothetical protein